MRIYSVLVVLLLATATVSASEAPRDVSKFNVICPATKLLPQLDSAYHQCRHELQGESCNSFISLYKQLLPEYDCQRSFDHTAEKDYVVPAIWLAGAAGEDFVQLLSKLKQPAARCLFGSSDFRATLDGAVAEQYLAASKRVERSLGATCNGL